MVTRFNQRPARGVLRSHVGHSHLVTAVLSPPRFFGLEPVTGRCHRAPARAPPWAAGSERPPHRLSAAGAVSVLLRLKRVQGVLGTTSCERRRSQEPSGKRARVPVPRCQRGAVRPPTCRREASRSSRTYSSGGAASSQARRTPPTRLSCKPCFGATRFFGRVSGSSSVRLRGGCHGARGRGSGRVSGLVVLGALRNRLSPRLRGSERSEATARLPS